MVDFASAVLDHQIVIVGILDGELEHDIQAGSGTGIKSGFHGFDDVGNRSHILLLFEGRSVQGKASKFTDK